MVASGFDYFSALVRPLREADRDFGRDLLARYLQRPQQLYEQMEALIQTLPDQLRADRVREELVDYLAPLVGFTKELRAITDRLTVEQKRRLIQVAIPLWNQRHTEAGIINTVRLLTGRSALLTSWFGYRNLLGETLLGEDQLVGGGDNWVIGGNTSLYDEYWSNIRLMDDGTLDELLLLDILRLMRPMSERLEIVLLDFLDRFDGELDKWTTLAGTAPSIVDKSMLIPAGTQLQPITPIKPLTADHGDYVAVTKFYLDPGATFYARWRVDGGDWYDVLISSASPQVVFRRMGTNQATLYSDDPAAVIVDEVWYKLRITVHNVGTERHLQIYIDANLVVPEPGGALSHYVDNVGASHQAGPYQYGATNADVYLDNTESWESPGRFAVMELSTAAEPGGEVTMTANFIQ